MTERRDTTPSDEETTVLRRGRVVEHVEEAEGPPGSPPGAPPPPEPFIDPGPSYEDPEVRTAAVEQDRVRVRPDGSVDHERERVERRPPRRPNPFADFWPAMLVLLALVLIGLGAVWYFTRVEERAVPDVTSQQLDVAIARVQDEGFDAAIVNRANGAPSGTVFEQRPVGGTELEEGKTVTLLVSNGPATVEIPNAVGLTEQEARDRMAEAGLKIRVFGVFSDEPEGTVVAQSPGAGEQVEKDAGVRLNVSKGSGLVDVPPVVGLTRASAEAELRAVGLSARVFEVPSTEPEGTVVAQNPSSGQLRQDSSVRLNVSTGQPSG